MNAVGVIVEYNPFHNGHKLHIEMAKKKSGCSHVVGVMSGNFLQRGEPAIFDKWKRAEMAVAAGVDLVIELPAVFAVRSAQFFAEGGVRLLNSLGIITHICFGAEYANIEILRTVATAMRSPKAIEKMLLLMKEGLPYAGALGAVVEEFCNVPANVISSPNNILAIEYLKAISTFAPHLQPIAINRISSGYHDHTINTPLASATAIRCEILDSMIINETSAAALPKTSVNIASECLHEGRGPVTLASLSSMIMARLRTMSLHELAALPDVSEGLHYKICESALKAANVNELLALIKSRRYPYTRLQRILIHALLGTKKAALDSFTQMGPLYARVLAFNTGGRMLLKSMNHLAKIPTIIKTASYLNSKQRSSGELTPLQTMLGIDTLTSDLYVLGLPNSNWNSGGWDFRLSPIYIP